MALPALATPSDLATWLGQTIASDDPRALAVLATSSTLVRARAGTNWVTAGGDLETDIPDGIGQVVVMVSARIWLNPSGASKSGTGPFSAEWLNGFELITAEAEMVDAAMGTATFGGVGVLQTTRGEIETTPITGCFTAGLPGTTENDTPFELWP